MVVVGEIGMYKGKNICVVVPAYNEQQQIRKVLTTMPLLVDRIVVVDDASRDETAQTVIRHGEEDPRILLLRHPVNSGVGAAIATGYLWARDNHMDIAVVMAGDGQMDPRDLPAILDPVAEEVVDFAKANRLRSPNAWRKIPPVRFIGNSALSVLTRIASGYWHISDSQSGYTAINRQTLQRIDWNRMFKRYGQPIDLLVRLNVEECRVRDVVTEPVYHVGERSKMKVRKVLFHISWLLVRMFAWRLREKYLRRRFHPLVLFYGAGLLSLLATAISALLNGPFQTPLLITGTLLLSIAMWLDKHHNRALES